MMTPSVAATAVDPDGQWLYRIGGMCALAVGVGYLVIIPLYMLAGTLPVGGEAKLIYLTAHAPSWWAIIALSVLTDLLYIPVALGLYLALKGINRNAMMLAVAFLVLFVALELAITYPNYAALMTLSDHYATASSAAQRALFIAGAEYESALLASPLIALYTILVPGIGIFMASLVMRHGVFGRSTAYLGLATGIVALIAAIGPLWIKALDVTVILVSLCTTVWFLLVGYRLYRLGQA